MLKPALTLLTALAITSSPVLAQDVEETCEIHVAASSPPLNNTDQVFFNVTGPNTNNSIIVKPGSPQTITGLKCTNEYPYFITGTSLQGSLSNNQPVGQCKLKAGPVYLSKPGNSIAVVFPQDFDCPK